MATFEDVMGKISEVRKTMLELAVDGKLQNSDFDHLNALERRIMEIEEANRPAYRPITLADMGIFVGK